VSVAGEDTDRRIAALEEAVRARDAFISTAAHELRNPLTPIALLVDALRTQARGLPEAGQLALGLDRLERAIAAYLRRTGGILNVSRLSSGKFSVELSEFDLSAVVREVVDNLAFGAERVGSPLRFSVPTGITGILDRLGFEEIVENLVTNAIKYGAGKPIAVSLVRDDPHACLRVRDHGIGISPADQARIFARFERAVAQSQNGGFGIGLWLVGQMVEAMGGTIAVESRIGEGSSFTVTLPLARKAEP
jgi:two-component system OmpR family sensor kinase